MAWRKRKRSKKRSPAKRKQSYRHAPLPKWFEETPWGTCRWCNVEILKDDGTPNAKRRWHPDCLHQYFIVTRQNYAKREVKKRDKGVCAHCGIKCRLRCEWDLDHIKPLIEAKGKLSYWQLGNLQTLCKSCHKIKTVAENIARRTKKRG